MLLLWHSLFFFVVVTGGTDFSDQKTIRRLRRFSQIKPKLDSVLLNLCPSVTSADKKFLD